LTYANEFVAGMTLQMFADDRRTLYAVTRCLEIISEASRRLPDSVKQRHPEIPWRAIAGAGNIYRHDYEDVAAGRIWQTVKSSPAPLRVAMVRELEALGDGQT
jgi:uncharacterized protein with HEPN domain